MIPKAILTPTDKYNVGVFIVDICVESPGIGSFDMPVPRVYCGGFTLNMPDKTDMRVRVWATSNLKAYFCPDVSLDKKESLGAQR